MYGTFDSGEASNIQINLKQCKPTTSVCKTVDLEKDLGDKWIAMLMNERTFDPQSGKVNELSRLTWTELQTDKPLEIQYQVN